MKVKPLETATWLLLTAYLEQRVMALSTVPYQRIPFSYIKKKG